jgi:flagellar hook-basal body complex protein FliE
MTGIAAISGALPSLPSIPTVSTQQVDPSKGGGFADQINGALSNLSNLQHNADTLAQQAATGTLEDVHDYTIAATEASLATDLTVAVRNKAVEAFQEIMRMQV